jgi:hypothetical protein
MLVGKNCSSAMLESDCYRVVQILSSAGQDKSLSWCLFSKGQELLKIYRHIDVSKVDHVSNGAAHVLAQLGKSGMSSGGSRNL